MSVIVSLSMRRLILRWACRFALPWTLLLPLVLMQARASTVVPLHYTTSWIGNSAGYGDGKWMPFDVRAIYVSRDGTVYSNAPWDESGGEIAVFKEGDLSAHAGHTHGWGNHGGDAITGNSRYIYAAGLIDNENGHLRIGGDWPSAGHIWSGVTRRLASDITLGKAFEGGRGNLGSAVAQSFLVVNDVPTQALDGEGGVPDISGLAADERELFVSNWLHDRVEVFDAQTMQKRRDWSVSEPGKLAIDADGQTIWVIQAAHLARAADMRRLRDPMEVRAYSRDGHPGIALPLPAGTDPTDVTVDNRGRILVADNGPRQQILVFSHAANAIRFSGAIGEPGGIFGTRLPRGTPGPLRFNGMTGVGVDAAGNLYVSNNGAGLRPARAKGTVLESYSPALQTRWRRYGLLFVDGADVDPAAPTTVYSGYAQFEIGSEKDAQGLSREGKAASGAESTTKAGAGVGAHAGSGSGSDAEATSATRSAATAQQNRTEAETLPVDTWRYTGFLPDRFKYPESPMLHSTDPGDAEPMVRRIDGRRFLYSTNMYSQFLAIYRFDDAASSEAGAPSRAAGGVIAIPSGYLVRQAPQDEWPAHHPDHAWLWRDSNGDGHFAANEYTVDPDGDDDSTCAGWWVDRDGGIWEARGTGRLRYLPLLGIDSHGNPIYRYSAAREFALPAPFTQVNRVIYDAAHDSLYLSGYTAEAPYAHDAWKQAGRVLSRYDGWLSGKRSHRYDIDLPWQRANGADASADATNASGELTVSTMSVAQAQDALFAVEMLSGTVHVYDAATGREWGAMTPGPEVGRHTGWVDVTQGISAFRQPGGDYLVFVEEDSRAKVLMYRWHP